MELQYKGANCITINTKSGTLVTDPKLSLVGLKDYPMNKADVCLLTNETFLPSNTDNTFIIDSAGEYEIKDYAIRGIATRAHIGEENNQDRSIIYRVSVGDIDIAIFGHVYPELSDEQLEAIGVVDIMTVPIGGNGYTLDAEGAAKMVRMISPKIVIPTHYAEASIDYSVPQNGVEQFIKELGVPQQNEAKLKVKSDTIGESMSIYVLERS